jgi:sugar lactone lactonase YvrE
VATATSDAAGSFTLQVPRSVRKVDVLYVTARGGSIAQRALPAEVELASALADLRSGPLVIDERTTVAAGYSLAQFASAGSLGGADPGLSNAALMPRNLVDVATGELASFFAQHPNGPSTESLASFNSLASIIAGCAAGTNDCAAFLDAATDAWGTRPQTTWQAMTLLPTNPAGDPTGVFAQVPTAPRFVPVRTAPPAAWVLALRFYGNGRQFNGPGNVAFDAQGRVWANNNAEWSVRPEGVCPGLEIFLLDPYAPGRPMKEYKGGGLNGAGFGIGLDPEGRVWVGNFGFTGSRCPVAPTSNSVSEFRPNGKPVSGDAGFTNGPLSWPQGTKSDIDGNIWIASCGNGTLVEYPKGNPKRATIVGHGIERAFDMAQNAQGNIFVTANGGDQVFAFGPDGHPLPGSPFGDSTTFAMPLGAASDSLGNVWVTNSGVIRIPCSSEETLEVPAPDARLNGSIVQVGPDGALARFGGAGMTIPWGIAVDGDDNLWVANFSGERLSHLCGARVSTCPSGAPGAPISPPGTGYAFDGLQRNTGVQIDPSGNVWLTNNWIRIPVQTDPFGDGLVVYLGMAAPVKTPLIGTPQQP